MFREPYQNLPAPVTTMKLNKGCFPSSLQTLLLVFSCLHTTAEPKTTFLLQSSGSSYHSSLSQPHQYIMAWAQLRFNPVGRPSRAPNLEFGNSSRNAFCYTAFVTLAYFCFVAGTPAPAGPAPRVQQFSEKDSGRRLLAV